MKFQLILSFLFLLIANLIQGQNVGINSTGANPNGTAMLDIASPDKGVLIPRVVLTATNSSTPITTPAISLLIYNTATAGVAPNNVTPGYYYWNGTDWTRIHDATINSSDHDWYEVGGTANADNINDNIFTQGDVGIGLSTIPKGKLDVNGDLILSGTSFSTLKNNTNAGREELIIRAISDAFGTGTNGAGLNVYGDNDNQHGQSYNASLSGGPLALLAGGDGRLIVSADGKIAVGNSLWNRHDDQLYEGVFNIYDPNSIPALFIKGASTSEGDIAIPDGEHFTLGHWNETTNSFTHRLNINTSGQMGIGTLTPDNSIHLHEGSSAATNIQFTNTTTGENTATDGFRVGLTSTEEGYIGSGTNAIGIRIAADAFLANPGFYLNAATNKVGIGTDAPNNKVDILHTTANEYVLDLFNNQDVGGYGMQIRSNGGNDDDILFKVSSDLNATLIEAFLILGDGNVGIGTHNPKAPLHVRKVVDAGTNSTASPASITIGNEVGVHMEIDDNELHAMSTNALGGTLFINKNGGNVHIATDPGAGHVFLSSSAGPGNVAIGGTVSATHKLQVTGTAGLTTGTAWTNTSDIRLKDIQSSYELGLKEIIELDVIRYNYKEGNSLDLPSDVTIVGFVAQEVQKVIPEAVIQRSDGFLELNVDPIHWASVNAIKELNQQNIDLQQQIDDLKALLQQYIDSDK